MTAEPHAKDPAAVELGRRGGRARSEKMTPEQRTEAARVAARARWPDKPPHQVIKSMLAVAGMTGKRYVLFRGKNGVEFAEEQSERAMDWRAHDVAGIVGTYDGAGTLTAIMEDLMCHA